MRLTEHFDVKKMPPSILNNLIDGMAEEVCKIEDLKNNFKDKQAKQEEKLKKLKKFWEDAKLSEDFDSFEVKIFVTLYNEYKKFLNIDQKEALLEAEYLEKKLNYTYEGFLNKKYWNSKDLFYIWFYLNDGKAVTLDGAIELLEKEKPNFLRS